MKREKRKKVDGVVVTSAPCAPASLETTKGAHVEIRIVKNKIYIYKYKKALFSDRAGSCIPRSS